MSEREFVAAVAGTIVLFIASLAVAMAATHLYPAIGDGFVTLFRDAILGEINGDTSAILAVKVFLNNLQACILLFLGGASLGVLTAFCYAGYLLVIRRGASDLRRTAGPVAVATASTAVVAMAFGAWYGDLDMTPGPSSLAWLALLGVTAQSLGYLFISLSLPRLPAVITSIILLAQPVATMALAMILLGESPSAWQLAGVVLVIGGIAVATVPLGRVRQAASSPAA